MSDYMDVVRRLMAETKQAPQPEKPVEKPADGLMPGDCVEIEAGDETLYVVFDEHDVRLLIDSAPHIHRGQVWTRAEIRALVAVADDAEVLAEIRRLKRTLPGRLTRE